MLDILRVDCFSSRFHEKFRPQLVVFQHPQRLPEEAHIASRDACVLIFGMGRIGTSAYDYMESQCPYRVTGIDFAPEVVAAHNSAGRNVIRASATDPDFWSRLELDNSRLRLVMLALPVRSENLYATSQLVKNGFKGRITALAKYQEDVPLLKEAGVHVVFNLYAAAGSWFADEAWKEVEDAALAEDPAHRAGS